MSAAADRDGRLVVNADLLTLRDMQRARKMLKELHGEQDAPNPWEILEEGSELRVALVLWCLKSRTDPSFTLDDAMDAPMSSFTNGDAGPPRGGRPRRKPPTPEPESSSAASSA